MIIIDEKKFNRLWTIARYVYGLYPIITTIIPALALRTIVYNNPLSLIFFAIGPILTLFILYRPRLGAYTMAAISGIGILTDISLSKYVFDSSEIMLMLSYIIFGLLAKLKETARQQ